MSQALEYSPRVPDLATPTLSSPGQRIDSLDLLRGISILGIFLMNTWTMSLPQNAYTNPATYSPDWVIGQGFPPYGDYIQPPHGWELFTFTVIHLFADMKFITTFSILFGAGIVMQAERSAKKGHNPWAVHYKRMAVLLCFGLAHAYGFWYGDILTAYALCGLMLAPLRLLPAGLLLFAGMLLVSGVSFIDFAQIHHWDFYLPGDTNHMGVLGYLQNWSSAYYKGGNDQELAIYRGTGVASHWQRWLNEIRYHRAYESFRGETSDFLTWDFLRCGGCILIGMALQKRRFFQAVWDKRAYATLAGIAIPIGWMVSYLGVEFFQATGWEEGWHSLGIMHHADMYTQQPFETPWPQALNVWNLGVEFNYWGSLISAFGYISFGVLLAIWAANPLRKFLTTCLIPFRAVGRMALTCYLTETLIGTTLFYGHGFGLFGYFTRVQLLPIVFATWAFILVFATVWLSYFRQGPLEWFWHSIVYWEWRNPRKSASGPDATPQGV